LKNWIRRKKNEGATETIVKNFVSLLGINVSEKTINREVRNHKSYPGLKSISEPLSLWRIDTLLVKTNLNELKDEDYPVIAHIREEGESKFIIIESVKNETVFYLNSDQGWMQENVIDFKKKWDGVTVLKETNETSGELDYQSTLRSVKLGVLKKTTLILLCTTLLFFVFSFGFANSTMDLSWLFALTLKIVGSIICLLLISEQYGRSSVFLRKLCNVSIHTNCSKVINSPVGKITDWLSMSEVGLIYFSGGFFSLLIAIYARDVHNIIPALGILSIISFPYSVFSIAYQYKIKSWCILCIITQLLIGMEVLLFFLYYPEVTLSLYNLQIMLPGFIFPLAIWIAIKPLIMANRRSFELDFRLTNYRKNLTGLMAIHSQGTELINSSEIVDVHTGGEYPQITLVINPMCDPCKDAYMEVKKLNKHFSNQLDISLKFLTPEKDGNGKAKEVITHLLSLHNAVENKSFFMAVDYWFTKADFDINKLKNKYPISDLKGEPGTNDMILAFQKWAKIHEVNSTPKIFIGKKSIPDNFSILEFEYYIKNEFYKNYYTE
jgi:hypothetical protein